MGLGRVKTLIYEIEKQTAEGSGGGVSVTFFGYKMEQGVINFRTSWKRYFGEMEFNSIDDLEDKLEKLSNDWQDYEKI